MNFTIFGAGNMGRAIATLLLKGGNSITIRDHDDAEAAKLAQELGSFARDGVSVRAATSGSPIQGDAVVLAVYYPSVQSIIDQYGNQFSGKIVVDITNPINATYDDLATPPGSSAAEEIAHKLPAGARVLKAFNTTFASTLIAGQVSEQPLDVMIAGDDAGAKQALAGAIKAAGMRPIDVGPLRRARQLEGIGLLHITLQSTLGTNWGSTIKILS